VSRPAAFLDRDGVINERPPPHEYVRDADDLVILPRTVEAIGLLAEAGYAPVVVSNQRGVARGFVSEEALSSIDDKIRGAGAPVAAFYYCPHDIEAECSCRKPAPGLLLRAAAELSLSLEDSVMIGDSESDILAGAAVGARTIRIAAGDAPTSAGAVAPDLWSAVQLLIGNAIPSGNGDRHISP
jgi:D-glycero-D-manno-heptose 1,7-bisphosphate phosphatase